MTTIRTSVGLALIGILLIARPAAAQRPGPPAPPPPSVELTAESGCGGIPAGPTLRLSWSGNRATLLRQRLEISAHHGGFETGLFAAVRPIARRGRARHSGSPNLPEAFFQSALAVTVESVQAPVIPGSIHVELERLQPNLHYFVRIATFRAGGWTPGPTVRQPISPCIRDGRESAVPQ